MCGVCVSVQGGSVAPSLYVAGFAAVGAVGWQRLRAMLPTRAQLEGPAHHDDALQHDDAALAGPDSDVDRGAIVDELVLTGGVGAVGSGNRPPSRARRFD